jgi:hypothetical protein
MLYRFNVARAPDNDQVEQENLSDDETALAVI